LSADTIVPRPSDPQSLNRFSFVRNNSLKYVDPSGHEPKEDCDDGFVLSCRRELPKIEDINKDLHSRAKKSPLEVITRWLRQIFFPSGEFTSKFLSREGYIDPQTGYKVGLSLEGNNSDQIGNFSFDISADEGGITLGGISFSVGDVEYSFSAEEFSIEVMLPLNGMVSIGGVQTEYAISSGTTDFKLKDGNPYFFQGFGAKGTSAQLQKVAGFYDLNIKLDVKIVDLKRLVPFENSKSEDKLNVPKPLPIPIPLL
jgi:hypothetical protein